MNKEEKIKAIERIIYWWRRYEGIRTNPKNCDGQDKMWRARDLDILERRLKEFIRNPKKYKFENPDMNIQF